MISSQSLAALACGDSYGSYYEHEGLLGVTFDINKLPNKPLFPKITDDTKMATILYKHYMKNKAIDVEALTMEYKYWAIHHGNEDGIGIHTRAVLLNGAKNKDSQGNGALMRVIPFGVKLIKDGYSFEKAVELMNIDAAITHKNETIFMCNQLCLDVAINGLNMIYKDEYKGLLSRLHQGNTAWVIHTVYIVIETLKQELNFLDGFKYIVSQGGDTDTNCAVYGAVKGCQQDIVKEINLCDFLPTSGLQDVKQI